MQILWQNRDLTPTLYTTTSCFHKGIFPHKQHRKHAYESHFKVYFRPFIYTRFFIVTILIVSCTYYVLLCKDAVSWIYGKGAKKGYCKVTRKLGMNSIISVFLHRHESKRGRVNSSRNKCSGNVPTSFAAAIIEGSLLCPLRKHP